MRLLVLTPAPDEPRVAALASVRLNRLGAALDPTGVRIEQRPWTQPGDLDDCDGVTTLLAWGGHQAGGEWGGLLGRLAAMDAPVINDIDTLRWNTRKTYLVELEAAGAPVTPTLFVDRVTPAALDEAHARFGDEIVVKPQTSGEAFATVRVSVGEDLDDLKVAPAGPAMLQPFMPGAAREGELSLLYFNGAFSHAVVKVARPGDFRVQPQLGGTCGAITPVAEALDVAERVLAAAGRQLTYARIDLIRDQQGDLRLMALEAIKPDLYLEHAPDGGAAFARAMLWALD